MNKKSSLPISPHVSVIIPVFNGESTIGRAVKSVFAQYFTDFELIIVDDGSTDQSVDFINEFARDNLRLIRHPHNLGTAAARNTGIAEARGRWIAFLDADDLWAPEKLARQIALIQQAGPNIKASASGFYLHKGGRKLTISLKLSPGQFRREILFGCSISPGTTLLVERQVFDELGGFDESFRRLEDWDWLLRYSERYDMAFAPEPLADVYLTTGKLFRTVGGVDPVLDAIHRIDTKYSRRLDSWTRRAQLRSSLLVERAAHLYRKRQPILAALLVIAALMIYPARNVAFFRTLWRSVFGVQP
jgi:glycosyltransferase involved in cell wall biosynthesis